MASLRYRPDMSGRPGGAGAGDAGPYFEPFQKIAPSSSGLRSSRREVGVNHERARTIPQPKMPASKLPQSFPPRRPSISQSEQSFLDRLPQSRGSAGSGNSSMPISSNSSASKLPGPSTRRQNVLRRKQSGLSAETHTRSDSRDESHRTSSSLSSNPRSQTSMDASTGLHFDRDLTASPMEIRVAQQVELPKTSAQTVTIYPELDRYRDLHPPARAESPSLELPYRIATHDLPPPTPLFSGASSQISGFSGSPSTRFSGSPGPGPYSRDTTPTSISSQSPGLVAPMRIPASVARMRQTDQAQTRPPVSRRRAGSISNETASVSAHAHAQGLAAVRESLTSSSSNSTVRDEDKKEKKKKKRLSPLPPSPPPRKSSQKFKKTRDEDESPSKPSREPAQPVMPSPSKGIATSSYSSHRRRPSLTAEPVVSPKATPPVRPSRDGTPDLQSQLGLPLPIIHSNLSSTSLSERRQSHLLATAPAPANLPVLSSSAPDRPSYLSRPPGGREPTPAPRSAVSGEGMSTSKPASGRTTRTPSPSISTLKTRFPIFGRRTKAVTEVSAPQIHDKPARKGPAAGTGHEGYGRLGSVRRKSNSVATVGRAIPGTMSSQESLSSNQSHDPFLLERMAPVVISGGEIVENRNTSSELCRTDSNQSIPCNRLSIESRDSSQASWSSREGPRLTLWPSPLPRPAAHTPSLGSRRPSDSSDSEALARSSLALRRSMQRLKSGERDAPRIPKPIVTRGKVVSPSIASTDASIMSDDSMFGPSTGSVAAGRELDGVATNSGPKKLLKRARSPRKWNFFSRSQSQPAIEKKQVDTSSTVAATVKVVQAKPVPFYAMMDSEQEDVDAPDLGEILREAKGVASHPPQVPSVEKVVSPIRHDLSHYKPIRLGNQPSMPAALRQVTSPVKLPRPSLPQPQPVPVPTPAPARQAAPVQQVGGRPSRLPQVGRIPKVVSARAEQVSPKSFSRPFHRLSYQTPIPVEDVRDAEFVAKGPSPPKISTPELTQDGSISTSGTNASALIYSLEQELIHPGSGGIGQEFLSFSPRTNSQSTTTTTSSSAGGLFPYSGATAVVPSPTAPLAEDEIWDEYNDLLGDDTMRVMPLQGASLRKTIQLDASKLDKGKQVEPPLESPTLSNHPMQSLDQALNPGQEPEKEPVTSSIYSLNFGEKIRQALDLDSGPVVSFSETEFSNGREEGDYREVVGQQIPQRQRDSSDPKRQVRQSDASGSSLGSQDSSPLSQVNLRVGSMTVSKWLTFGHVLFSPVRDELIPVVGSLKRHSILVIDGLGNDDWSFYAAETYPAATFFNLSPRPPLPTDYQTSSAFPLSPPNHHQIQYTSHAEKFPFGPQSFTSVVFRFPSAAPEAHYQNVMSEARRVLKPGGFIELAILDVDLNNMGNRGRRAIRRLKERIHARAPDTSLGSTSDLMLRLLGRKGFADIKTCRVGVPVASAIGRSSSSETSQQGKRASNEVTRNSRDRERSKHRKDDRSLPEMISDEGPVADESITKMVAKVGRWWYSRCYESAAAAAAGPRAGLWNDRALLAECEEWGTSLKLMVCHARVPDGRARVASI
ncbi:hypothetical protein B0H66DRAFT_121611 [Apodospora peruviana]|uniref:Methyltransferase type 11 domain-containing protein n=1 Tax=Apodospora peruviana TaxID=516989 RepID=A0AAE0II17_9PEZI|nr:hypothetical protein B0H66DRAFT_121611 [Apodospora peruviana]